MQLDQNKCYVIREKFFLFAFKTRISLMKKVGGCQRRGENVGERGMIFSITMRCSKKIHFIARSMLGKRAINKISMCTFSMHSILASQAAKCQTSYFYVALHFSTYLQIEEKSLYA
jgi:hypothetical protein